MTALLPTLLRPSHLSRGIAVSSAANQTATIVGPALGGLLYAAGAAPALATAGVMPLVAAALIVWTRPLRPATVRPEGGWRSAFSGIAYIRHRPILLGAISLDLFAVLLGGATALLPIYARDILATGPWGLGLLRAAPAIGALSMSLMLARMPVRRGAGRLMFGAVIAFGAAMVVFALSRNLALSLAALLVTGAADNVSVVIRSTLVQLAVTDAVRGRVSAVNSLFIGTSNQLGEFRAGIVAGLLGAVPAVLLGGIGTIAVALLWMRLFPQLRRIESLAEVEPLSQVQASPPPLAPPIMAASE